MTRNPFAHPIEEPEEQLIEAPPRVSVMALLSIILSVICCIPGLGLLGSIFGGASLIAVGKSGGRLKGRGMAIAGLVVGLFVTIVWIGLWFGFSRSFGMALGSASTTMSAIEAGDWNAARPHIVLADGSSITDEQLASFRTRYQAAAGSFTSMPTGMIELIRAYRSLGPTIQKYQRPGGPFSGASGSVIPIVATFDQGQFIIAAEINPTASKGGVRFQDLVVSLPDGTEVRLLPPPPPPPPSLPSPPPGGGP